MVCIANQKQQLFVWSERITELSLVLKELSLAFNQRSEDFDSVSTPLFSGIKQAYDHIAPLCCRRAVRDFIIM